MHREFDFANATARQLDVIAAFRVAGAAARRMLPDLAVQHPQRVENVVVEIAPEYERQHGRTQSAGAAVDDPISWRDDAAFEPGKALPLAALYVKILLQRGQRDRRRAGVPIGPQREVNAKHKSMLGGVANQAVDLADRLAEVLLIGKTVASFGIAGGLAIAVIDIDEVDVTGDVEFARAKFAHADNPQARALAVVGDGSAVGRVEHTLRMGPGAVQGEAGQPGHRLRDVAQRLVMVAVEQQQALQHQLAQDAQARTEIVTLCHQGVQRGSAVRVCWNAGCQQVQQ